MARASPDLGQIRIGISGWTYAPWRGVFYPPDLPQRRELEWASRQFRSIEINGTFYGLQKPESFLRWHEETPEDFAFAVKAPRYLTHLLRLREIDIPFANFLASGVLKLGAKLGPMLWQFPPRLRFDPERFEPFLAMLPTDTEQACALGRRHDGRVAGSEALELQEHRVMRHAVEIRHDGFRSAEFIEMLRHHGVALVCADTVDWPRLMDLTSDFVYCRLHGSEELYVSGYNEATLDRWAARVRAWASGGEPEDAERVLEPTRPQRKGRDVYMYFDNDVKVRAPADAASLARRLGASPHGDNALKSAIDPNRVSAAQEATVRRTWPRVRRAKL